MGTDWHNALAIAEELPLATLLAAPIPGVNHGLTSSPSSAWLHQGCSALDWAVSSATSSRSSSGSGAGRVSRQITSGERGRPSKSYQGFGFSPGGMSHSKITIGPLSLLGGA